MSMNTVPERLAALRAAMDANGVDLYLIPVGDPHSSEYLPDHYTSLTYFSGFHGENSNFVVTRDKSALWADGRYFVQAEKEIAGTEIELERMGEPGVPTVEQYCADALPEGGVLGLCGLTASCQLVRSVQKALDAKHGTIKTLNLEDELWTEGRPALPETPAWLLSKEYAGFAPAEKLEHSKILWLITVVFGFIYIVYYFVQNGFTLGLNIVNMIFLFLGLLLHGDLRRYVDAIGDAAAGAAGILLQFPFYAGIMGMMVAANAEGVSLAGVISQFFVNISNNVTFPMLSFLAAGVVNFFVPSGGGQWAVQGPIMMPAGANLGIDAGRTAMAIAWGDQWTNMIQPFWALPALGIAKLSARDIMGYLVVVLLFTGVVACLGFLGWALFF